MLKHAFKEWAVICQALALGRQALILRKGGIAESHNVFKVEHQRFWLFPTYVHQQRDGIKPEAVALLDQVEQDKPPDQVVRVSHYVEVAGIYQVSDLSSALILNHLHLWSEETIRTRFAYRRPGLCVLPIRVFRVADAIELPVTDKYAGCKSWVELEQGLSTENSTPVLENADFHDLLRSLDTLLRPTALA